MVNMIILAVVFVIGAFIFQVTLSGFSRKVVARIQKRRGPTVFQNFYDIGKLLFKESSISHGFIFDFGIWMALGSTIATLLFMPVGGWALMPKYANIIVIIYLLAVGSLGMAMSAVGSGNPLASIGVSRALTQMFAYELPFVVIAVLIIYLAKSSNILKIIEYQTQNGWNLFSMPIGALVAYISLMGMLGKKPFDTPIAPAEIASGPLVEYSGKYLGFLMIQHEFATFIEVGLFVHLFMGSTSIIGFLIKYIIVYISAVMISSVMARLKIDEVVKFYWRWPLGLAILQAIITLGVRF